MEEEPKTKKLETGEDLFLLMKNIAKGARQHIEEKLASNNADTWMGYFANRLFAIQINLELRATKEYLGEEKYKKISQKIDGLYNYFIPLKNQYYDAHPKDIPKEVREELLKDLGTLLDL